MPADNARLVGFHPGHSNPPDVPLRVAVDVPPVADAEDDYLASCVVDPIQDSVSPSPGTPNAVEFASQWGSQSPRIVEEWSRDEVDNRKCDRLGEGLLDRPGRRSSNDDLVSSSTHLGRRALTASVPRTKSPSK